MKEKKMFENFKAWLRSLFGSKPTIADEKLDHSVLSAMGWPESVEKPKSIETPQPVAEQEPKVNPEANWPFPTVRPDEVEQPKPINRKRRNPPKVAAVAAPQVKAEPAKKTPKEIAAERRKAEGNKDRRRAKGKK